jgi:hemoglobin-like flavoprotein
MLSGGDSERTVHLERLAKLHSRTQMDIKPELYDLWLDRLMQAVEEFDPMFNMEIEIAWRRLLQPGIEFMKSRY